MLERLRSVFSFARKDDANLLHGTLSNPEGGFVDIDLPIIHSEFGAEIMATITALGVIQDAVVGFVVDLYSDWRAEPIQNTTHYFYFGWVRLRSTGAPSDSFIRLLTKSYQLDGVASKMTSSMRVEAVGLGDDPRDIWSKPIRMKLFFKSGNDSENYAESFLNIDLKNKVLQFHEKDPEYRSAIICEIGQLV